MLKNKNIVDNNKQNLSLTKKKLLEKMLNLKHKDKEETKVSRIIRHDKKCAPLSYSQQRLWFINEMMPNNSVYNEPIGLSIKGNLDVSLLMKSFREIVKRHDILRTSFAMENEEPVQIVHDDIEFHIPVIDLCNFDANKAKKILRSYAAIESTTSFDLTNCPLFRFLIIKISDTEHIIIYVTHHIIFDGWSMNIMMKEIKAYYDACMKNTDVLLPELKIQYSDYAIWQKQFDFQSQIDYWKEKLKDVSPSALQTDFIRPAKQTFEGSNFDFKISETLCKFIHKFSATNKTTTFNVMLTAFNILLYRLTNETNIAVGCPVTGRNMVETEQLIGFFVNILVMYNHVEGHSSFLELLSSVKANMLEAFLNQDAPLSMVVKEMNLERDKSRNPLFQVSFVYQNIPEMGLSVSDILFEQVNVYNRSISKFDLTLELYDSEQEMKGRFEYNTDLFIKETIVMYSEIFLKILEDVMDNPNVNIDNIDILTTRERENLNNYIVGDLVESYRTKNTLGDLLMEQASKTPDATAIWCDDNKLTYSELNERTNKFANFLIHKGLKKEDIVGVNLERSTDMIIAIHAIIKAGGIYLPLEPTYPAKRIQYLCEDAKPKIIITDSKFVNLFQDKSIPYIKINEIKNELKQESNEFKVPDMQVSDAVYMIYTSGSTGNPKGVINTHEGVVNRLLWANDIYQLTKEDKILFKTPFSFDVSVWEIFGPLIAGSSIVIAKPDGQKDPFYMEEMIEKYKVTILHFVPSMLNAFILATTKQLDSLRIVLSSGEALSQKLADDFYDKLSAKLINLYGPTEAAIDVTYWWCNKNNDNIVPIGNPIANTSIYILDKNLNIVPRNVIGKLYIGGVALARGYHNQPALTADKFLPDPFSKIPGLRMYDTGDYAKYLSDGSIAYLGREDNQVKIRGYRIELQEIENEIRKVNGVEDAVVVENTSIKGKLIAYLVIRDNKKAVSVLVKKHLQEVFPEFMVINYFMIIDKLPLLPNGKVNRKALPTVDQQIEEDDSSHNVAMDQKQIVLANVWSNVLGVHGVGLGDNFFHLGGHSILATKLILKIQEAFGVKLPLNEIFEHPVLSDMCNVIKQYKDERETFHIPELTIAEKKDFLPLSYAQKRIWVLSQLEESGAAYNVSWAIKLIGSLNKKVLFLVLDRIMEENDILCTSFVEKDGKPIQLIHKDCKFPISEISLVDLEENMKDDKVKEYMIQEKQRKFELEVAPLLHGLVLQTEEDSYILQITLSHIISDGWSAGILAKEINEKYNEYLENKPMMSKPEIQYADYAIWQNNWIDNLKGEQIVQFWNKKLKQPLPKVEVIPDYERPAYQTFNGRTEFIILPKDKVKCISQFCMTQNVSKFMLLYAAFSVLIYRYTGEEDIIVGTPISGRTDCNLNNMLGNFINILPIRTSISGSMQISDLLKRVRKEILDVFQYQELPFEKMLQSVYLERDLSRTPVFQQLFIMQNNEIPEIALTGLKAENIDILNKNAKYDLTLSVSETKDTMVVELEYNTDLYKSSTAKRLLENYVACIDNILVNSETNISDIHLLTNEQYENVIGNFCGHVSENEDNSTMIDLFQNQVHEHGNRIAVTHNGRSLTYSELDRYSDLLASSISDTWKGQRERFIGIYMERGIEAVVAVLATLKLGAAYIPLDITYPDKRLQYMVDNSKTNLIITSFPMEETAKMFGSKVITCSVAALSEKAEVKYQNQCTAFDTAYVIYTSGSTGNPKGVMVPHSCVVNIFHDIQQRVCSDNSIENAMWSTTLSFDISVLEFLFPLCTGSKVVIADKAITIDGRRLCDFIERNKITFMQATPVTWNMVMETNPEVIRNRKVLCGGEALSAVLGNRIGSYTDTAWNMYGPTETTIWSSAYNIKKDNGLVVPIGKPLRNTRIVILDDNKQLVPIGVVGEIYIAGDGVTQGYLNNPILTAEKFVPDEFSSIAGRRMFRTGDKGRYLDNGDIQFMGRNDFQVKIRGYRIEILEIENKIKQYAGVHEVVVNASKDQLDNDILIAYIELAIDKIELNDLKKYLSETLPVFMIPSRFYFVQKLPLAPNGKIDRKQLYQIQEQIVNDDNKEITLPRNETESELYAIFEKLLNINSFGIYDDFFMIGGHSLLAIRLISEIKNRYHVLFTLMEIFKNSTVAKISMMIQEKDKEDTESNNIEQITPDKVNKYEKFMLTDIQQAYWVGRQKGIYGMSSVATHIYYEFDVKDLSVGQFKKALMKVINRHDMLRTVFTEQAEQRILQKVPEYEIERYDSRDKNGFIHDDETIRVREKLSHEVIDYVRWPLFHIVIGRVSESISRIHLSFDLLIADAWSMQIIMRDLVRYYNDLSYNPESIEVSFRDYVLAESKLVDRPIYQKSERYWKNKIKTMPLAPQIPLNSNYERIIEYKFTSRKYSLGKEKWSKVKQHASSLGVTPSAVLLTAFAQVLAIWAKEPRFTINLTVFSRLPLHKQVDEIVGDFTTICLLDIDLSQQKNLDFRVKSVQEELWKAMDYRYYSGVKVMRELNKYHKQGAFMPIVFTSTLGFANVQDNTLNNKFKMVNLNYSITQTPQVWLDHQVSENDGKLDFNWDMVDEVFPSGLAQKMFETYCNFLEQLSENEEIWKMIFR